MIAEDLQNKYGLKVLRLCLDRSQEETAVVFDVSVESGKQVARFELDVRAIGLPQGPAEELSELRFAIPDQIVSTLKGIIKDYEPETAPLWLQLESPAGLLAAVPWERLLQPTLDVPILRLPYHPIMPPPPRGSLDAVLCFSSPVRKKATLPEGVIQRFVQQIPSDLASFTTFHVFADAGVQRLLHQLRDQFGQQYRIKIYDPEAYSKSKSSAGLRNAWLAWMKEALHGQSADVVHFLCHGFANREEGALALAESPTRNVDSSSADFVCAAELTEFFNQIGAWSVAFSSPPGNYFPAGLRLLQDQIAQLRPGPCLVHDMDQQDSGAGLAAVYRFLYMTDWQPAPASDAISLYCHPSRYAARGIQDETSEYLLKEYTLVGRVPHTAEKSPAWVQTSQRVLEQWANKIAAPAENEADAAAKEGSARALKFLANVLGESAANPDSEPEE